jgi:hypothetical protein
MFTSAIMAFKTRNVPSAFNESQHIANAIFALLFFAIIIVPLDTLVQDNPNASMIIQGIGQAFLGIVLSIVLFGPKLYYIVIGKSNDKTMLTQQNTSTKTKKLTADTATTFNHINNKNTNTEDTTNNNNNNNNNNKKKSPKVSPLLVNNSNTICIHSINKPSATIPSNNSLSGRVFDSQPKTYTIEEHSTLMTPPINTSIDNQSILQSYNEDN